MLRNVSYNNPEITREINSILGPPFSFFESIKKKGTGSPKLKIVGASTEILALLNVDQRIHTGNIELRPHGLIVGFRSRLESYAFIVPFYKLILYKGESDSYVIYHDKDYVKVAPASYDKPIHKFMKKIIATKATVAPVRIEDL